MNDLDYVIDQLWPFLVLAFIVYFLHLIGQAHELKQLKKDLAKLQEVKAIEPKPEATIDELWLDAEQMLEWIPEHASADDYNEVIRELIARGAATEADLFNK